MNVIKSNPCRQPAFGAGNETPPALPPVRTSRSSSAEQPQFLTLYPRLPEPRPRSSRSKGRFTRLWTMLASTAALGLGVQNAMLIHNSPSRLADAPQVRISSIHVGEMPRISPHLVMEAAPATASVETTMGLAGKQVGSAVCVAYNAKTKTAYYVTSHHVVSADNPAKTILDLLPQAIITVPPGTNSSESLGPSLQNPLGSPITPPSQLPPGLPGPDSTNPFSLTDPLGSPSEGKPGTSSLLELFGKSLGQMMTTPVITLRPYQDSKAYTATIHASDAKRDLALLAVKDLPEPPKTLSLRDMETAPLQLGEEVFTIGNPLGMSDRFSAGHISHSQRSHKMFPGVNLVDTDTPINPGNSGGALLDTENRVVGIVEYVGMDQVMGLPTRADGMAACIRADELAAFLKAHLKVVTE